MFREVDKEPSSTLTFDEFCKVMQHRMHAKDPRDEAMKVFQLFDQDKTGKISFKNQYLKKNQVFSLNLGINQDGQQRLGENPMKLIWPKLNQS